MTYVTFQIVNENRLLLKIFDEIYNSIIELIDSLIKIHPNFSILNEIKLYHILIFFCSIRLIMEILDKKNNRKKIILFLFTAIFDLTITIGYYLYDRKKKGK